MSSRESYFRRGPLAFTVCVAHWTDDDAAERATRYLVAFVRGLTDQGVRRLYAAMMHRRDRGHFEETPEGYAQALTELQRHEVLAWHDAVKDWLIPPTVGHQIYLTAAGDTSQSF